MDIERLRYPVGPWDDTRPFTPESRQAALAQISSLPAQLRAAVRGMSDPQLDTPYRPQGWTARQVVHHVADSHVNGFIRTKLALTEPSPTIRPYDENAWAKLADATLPVEISLGILDGLHARWTTVFEAMTASDYSRTFVHPERGQTMTLEYQLHHYAWHCAHHLAHVTGLREREGW